MTINDVNIRDVVYVAFPFEEDPSVVKARPAIIIGKNTDELKVLVVKVTSHEPRDKYDYKVVEWVKANLKCESTARASQIKAFGVENVERKLGTLDETDYNEVIKLVNKYIADRSK